MASLTKSEIKTILNSDTIKELLNSTTDIYGFTVTWRQIAHQIPEITEQLEYIAEVKKLLLERVTENLEEIAKLKSVLLKTIAKISKTHSLDKERAARMIF